MSIAASDFCAEQFVPEELSALPDPQTAIPAIAKDVRLTGLIEEAVKRFPTRHDLHLDDARAIVGVANGTACRANQSRRPM